MSWQGRQLVVLSLFLATSCARGAHSPATPSSGSKAPPGSVASGWHEYELTADGIFARFPTEPVESSAPGATGVSVHSLEVSDGNLTYGCARVRTPKYQTWDTALPVATSYFRGSPAPAEAPPMGDFSGKILVGENMGGNRQLLEAYPIGDSVVIAWVTGRGSELDHAASNGFFQSIRFAMPWRVRGFPSLGLAVAVPAFAVPQATSSTFPEVALTVGGAFALGYAATVIPVDASSGVKPARVLELAARDVSKRGRVLSSEDIESDGIRGREITINDGTEFLRVQLYARAWHIYEAVVFSKALSRTNGLETKKFFDSVRWYP